MTTIVLLHTAVALPVPLHHRLSQRWDPADGSRLVRTNGIRTVGWTARAMVALAMAELAT